MPGFLVFAFTLYAFVQIVAPIVMMIIGAAAAVLNPLNH